MVKDKSSPIKLSIPMILTKGLINEREGMKTAS